MFKPASAILVLSLAACAKTHVSGEALSAVALKQSSLVYGRFLHEIHKKRVVENNFIRFAADETNYSVAIVETSDAVYYSFFLRPYRGRAPLDERYTFRVEKSSSSVDLVLALPK